MLNLLRFTLYLGVEFKISSVRVLYGGNYIILYVKKNIICVKLSIKYLHYHSSFGIINV